MKWTGLVATQAISVDGILARIDGSMLKSKRNENNTPVALRFVPLLQEEQNKMEKLNIAISNSTTKETIALICDILWVWKNCRPNLSARPLEDAVKVFGESFRPFIGTRLLFTLTADGQEFRCWYGIPGYMTAKHVDSDAEGMLFWVRGAQENIQEYIDGIVDEEQLNVVILPNGVSLYGLYFE